MNDILKYIEGYLGKESVYCADLLDELSYCGSQKEADELGKIYHADISYYSENVGILEQMISISVRSPFIENITLEISISSGIGSGTQVRYYDFVAWSDNEQESIIYKKLLR